MAWSTLFFDLTHREQHGNGTEVHCTGFIIVSDASLLPVNTRESAVCSSSEHHKNTSRQRSLDNWTFSLLIVRQSPNFFCFSGFSISKVGKMGRFRRICYEICLRSLTIKHRIGCEQNPKLKSSGSTRAPLPRRCTIRKWTPASRNSISNCRSEMGGAWRISWYIRGFVTVPLPSSSIDTVRGL